MQAIGVANGRIAPDTGAASSDQRLALYDSMFANAGTYTVEADQVIHRVDISWNETWAGTNHFRHFVVSGDTLTLTAHIADPANGTEAHYVAVWEKVA